jgi:hypothetical protein
MRLVLVALVLVVAAAGCGSGGDPFEEGAWDIKLQNDTARAVVIGDCETRACARFRYIKRLAPRASASALDYGDGTSWWLVSASGRRIGCLTLGVSSRVEGVVVRVSDLQPCPAV